MAYFTISHGLRGFYTRESRYIIRATTRRELKQAIAYEAESYREAGFIGANKRAIASIAAQCWSNLRDSYAVGEYVLPLARGKESGYAFGVFVSRATRAEYLAQEESI